MLRGVAVDVCFGDLTEFGEHRGHHIVAVGHQLAGKGEGQVAAGIVSRVGKNDDVFAFFKVIGGGAKVGGGLGHGDAEDVLVGHGLLLFGV